MPPYARKNRAPQAPTERILSQLAEEAEEQIRRLLAEAPQAGTSTQAEVPEAKLPEEPSAAEAESSS